MKQPTQEERILDLLRRQEWVTQVELVQRYILRGAARIRELRSRGFVIDSRIVKGGRVAEYHLVSEPAEEEKGSCVCLAG